MKIVRFVNSVFESNTFLIKDESGMCFLVDCGDAKAIIQYLQCQRLVLKAVFITHTHYDHIYGLNMLLKVYPQLPVYTSLHGQEGLYSDKLNLSKYHSDIFIFRYDNVEVLQEGREVKLLNDELIMVYETPGHDWSSLCYKVGNAVFTGDSYLPQYDLIASFPKSNKEDAARSLERIKYISTGCDLYPGHGDIVYA